jgi:hypothetical protein
MSAMKKWWVWRSDLAERLIWMGTDADAASWRRQGFMVEEY